MNQPTRKQRSSQRLRAVFANGKICEFRWRDLASFALKPTLVFDSREKLRTSLGAENLEADVSRYGASDNTSLTASCYGATRILITIPERNVSTGIVSEPTSPTAGTSRD
jgi:hypothetical protein